MQFKVFFRGGGGGLQKAPHGINKIKDNLELFSHCWLTQRLRDSILLNVTGCLFAQVLSVTLKLSNEWRALTSGIASPVGWTSEIVVVAWLKNPWEKGEKAEESHYIQNNGACHTFFVLWGYQFCELSSYPCWFPSWLQAVMFLRVYAGILSFLFCFYFLFLLLKV